jgi:hypothetical protein
MRLTRSGGGREQRADAEQAGAQVTRELGCRAAKAGKEEAGRGKKRREERAREKKQWAFGPKMRERVFLLFLIPFLFLVFQSKFKCKPNANSNRV